jgi:hypothetical protein
MPLRLNANCSNKSPRNLEGDEEYITEENEDGKKSGRKKT